MSNENVEIVRASIEAANSADFDLERWLDDFFDPEIEWHDVPVLPNAGVHCGRAAFRRHVADYLEAWADSRFEIEHMEAAGGCVVVRGRYGGVGRQSGAEVMAGGGVEGPASSSVYELRAGRIVRVRQFVEHAEALDAAGLPE
jgi:ketosteroid isomerase-like protein